MEHRPKAPTAPSSATSSSASPRLPRFLREAGLRDADIAPHAPDVTAAAGVLRIAERGADGRVLGHGHLADAVPGPGTCRWYTPGAQRGLVPLASGCGPVADGRGFLPPAEYGHRPVLVVVRGGLEALAAAALLAGGLRPDGVDGSGGFLVAAPPGQWAAEAAGALVTLADARYVREVVLATGAEARARALGEEAVRILHEGLDRPLRLTWWAAPAAPSWLETLRWARSRRAA